jgi:hypothetical protein
MHVWVVDQYGRPCPLLMSSATPTQRGVYIPTESILTP